MRRASRYFLYVVLVLAPVLLGSNRAIFWAVNAILTSASILPLLLTPSRSWPMSSSSPINKLVIFLVAAPILWMLVQLVPQMPELIAHPVWQSIAGGLNTISIDPAATGNALLWWLAMPVVFVAYSLGRRQKGRQHLMIVMILLGLAEAIFGMFNLYFKLNTVGLLDQDTYLGYLTGTFINRNSLASFLGMTLIALCSLTIFQLRSSGLRSRRRNRVATYFLILTSRLFLNYAGMTVIFVALLLTGSRAGVFCTLLGLLTIFALSRSLTTRRASYYLAAFAFGLTLALSTGALLDRSNDAAQSTQSRVEIAKDAIVVIGVRPYLGHGAGTYAISEPLTHIPSLPDNFVYNHAHNSYLEAAADLGIPFALSWLIAFCWLIYLLWKKAELAMRQRFQPASAAFLAIFVAESLHSIVDFSIQVQANAIYAACLLGLAWAELERESSLTQDHKHNIPDRLAFPAMTELQ